MGKEIHTINARLRKVVDIGRRHDVFPGWGGGGEKGGFETVKMTKRDEERGRGEREEQGNGMVDKAKLWEKEKEKERWEKRESERGKKRFLAWRNKWRKLMVRESADEDGDDADWGKIRKGGKNMQKGWDELAWVYNNVSCLGHDRTKLDQSTPLLLLLDYSKMEAAASIHSYILVHFSKFCKQLKARFRKIRRWSNLSFNANL